jgi:hypothetical protein
MPVGYTLKRRIGSVKTDTSAHIIPFFQDGERFYWTVPPTDVAMLNPNGNYVLSTPLGVPCVALLRGSASNSTATADNVLVKSPFETAGRFANNTTMVIIGTGQGQAMGHTEEMTDTASKVNISCANVNTGVGIVTRGWIDRRGR